jgi:hypothetical protein
MEDDEVYQAVKSRTRWETKVRRTIAVVVCCSVRWRACDCRHVVASLANPLRVASPSFMPARTSLQARRLQAFLQDVQARRLQALLQDGANVARWLAYKDSYCPSNLSGRIAPFFEPPFGFTTAFSRPPLLHSAGRGMRRAVCRVCPDPPELFLVGHSEVLNSYFWGAAPRGPGVYPRVGYGL